MTWFQMDRRLQSPQFIQTILFLLTHINPLQRGTWDNIEIHDEPTREFDQPLLASAPDQPSGLVSLVRRGI